MFSENADFVDEQFRRWQQDPTSVDSSWRGFFEGMQFAGRLTGSPIQRLRSVLLRGLAVGCQSDRRVTCVLRAELRASDARRLGFRSRTGRAISLGSVRFVASVRPDSCVIAFCVR